jgi:hypothetical protein
MSVSAHGDRKHCSSITTARRKKHLFHLTKGIRDPFDTTCCAHAIGGSKSRALFGASRAQYRAIFSKCSKPRFHKGFCGVINGMAAFLPAAEQRAGGTEPAVPGRSEGAQSPVKKILENVGARASPLPGFDENRANRLQVIRRQPRLR